MVPPLFCSPEVLVLGPPAALSVDDDSSWPFPCSCQHPEVWWSWAIGKRLGPAFTEESHSASVNNIVFAYSSYSQSNSNQRRRQQMPWDQSDLEEVDAFVFGYTSLSEQKVATFTLTETSCEEVEVRRSRAVGWKLNFAGTHAQILFTHVRWPD